MPFVLDTPTRKKLVIVKQLYQQGVDLLSSSSDMGRIMSAISFHLSIETILKLAMSFADNSKTPKSDFNNLIQQLDTALPNHGLGEVPDKAHINDVRGIRNAAQHEARVPNATELSECHIYTRDFLASFVYQVWGITMSDISLVDSIQNVAIRDLMKKAEAALTQGDINETIRQSGYALTWAIRRVRYTFISRPIRSPAGDVQRYSTNLLSPFSPSDMPRSTWQQLLAISDNTIKEFSKTADNLYQVRSELLADIDNTQAILVFAFLKLNYIEFLKFQSIVGTAKPKGREPEEVEFHNPKSNPDVNDAEFVFHYCVDTIVQIESQIGAIQQSLLRRKI